MFTDVIAVKGGWDPREESVDACGARLAEMVFRLAPLHPGLAALRWHGAGRQAATRSVLDLARAGDLARLMIEDRTYHPERKIMLADGYRLDAAGRAGDGPHIVLSVHAGSGAEYPDRFRHPNDVSISFVLSGGGDVDIFPVLKPALHALVAAWEPEWAGLYSSMYCARSGAPFGSRLGGAWSIYLAESLARQISPPASAMVERYPGGALLVSATEEPFNADNPAHVGVADAMKASLDVLE